MWSWCFADNENAHEENHDEKNPHEKPVHHFCDLLPLRPLGARGPLLSETVGDILHVSHQLGVHPTTMCTEHTGTKGYSRALKWRLFVFGAAGKLLVFRIAGDFLVLSAAVPCADFTISTFILSRRKAREVAPLLSCDVVLGFHSRMVLWFRGLGPGVSVILLVLPAMGAVVLVSDIILGRVNRRRGGGGGGGTVLTHLINKENLGHVVNDEDFCPVGNWFGLCTTEVYVHDEDGERCGGCNHCHSGNIVLSCVDNKSRQKKIFFMSRTYLQNNYDLKKDIRLEVMEILQSHKYLYIKSFTQSFFLFLPISGTLSDGGMLSATISWKTVRASKTVTPRETFSPESAGR